MDSLALFSLITQTLLAPIRAEVAASIDAVFPAVIATLTVIMTIWIAMLGYRIALGRGGDDSLGAMLNGFIFAAAVGAAITVTNYHASIEAVAIDLPNAVSAALSGAPQGADRFDQLFARMWAGGDRIMTSLSGFSASSIGMAILVVIYWIVSTIIIAIAYAVWLFAQVALLLVIAVGPLFLPMFLFSFFRGYFSRFVGVLLSIIVLQILINVLLSVMIAGEIALLGSLKSADLAANPYAGARMILACLAMFVIAALLLKELPGITTAVAGGAHLGTAAGRIQSAIGGYATGVAGRIGGGIGSAVSPGRAMTAVRRAANRPPGQSLGSPGP